jgi:hypothetical protein
MHVDRILIAARRPHTCCARPIVRGRRSRSCQHITLAVREDRSVASCAARRFLFWRLSKSGTDPAAQSTARSRLSDASTSCLPSSATSTAFCPSSVWRCVAKDRIRSSTTSRSGCVKSARSCRRKQKLDLLLGLGRAACGGDVYAGWHGKALRCRPEGMACRRARAYCRSSGTADCCAVAVELEDRGRCSARLLGQTLPDLYRRPHSRGLRVTSVLSTLAVYA